MTDTGSNGFKETRELPRIEVRWPVTLMAEKGAVDGEARNITAKGVYILFKRTTEELVLNESYRLLIRPPGEKIIVSGKLVWSNLDIMPRMGFCLLSSVKETGSYC